MRVWNSLEELRTEAGSDAPWYYLTTKATPIHWDVQFPKECYFVFGPETRGLPESLLAANPAACLRIPMQGTRSLNLSTSVAIVLYETLRQHK